MRSALAFALMLALLAGCGGEGDTKRHEAAGFSLAVPSGWETVKAGEALSTEEAEQFRRDNPAIAPHIEAASGENSPVKFLAFDPDTEEGFSTNVNVVIVEFEDEVPFHQWVLAAKKEVRSLETRTGEVAETTEELPPGEALRLEYEQEFRFGAETKRVKTIQYGFVSGTRSYVLTFTTLPRQLDEYEPVFRAVAESFDVT